MEPGRLERCRRRLYNRWPLLGRWLRRRTVKALGRDGSPEAVDLLADAAIASDRRLGELALAALARRAGEGCGEAREALCRLAVHHADGPVRAAALAGGHEPREPGPRALFYFLTGQWGRYEALDFDRGLLRAAYRAAGGPLRQRIAEAARRAGRVEWVEAVTRDAPADMLAELGDPGWQATVEVLSAAQQWPEMWRLAQEAPAAWAARLLNRLREAGWQPAQPAEFEELARLAKGWEEPEVAALPRARTVVPEPAAPCTALALTPDGRLLACADEHGSVQLRRLPAGDLLRSLGALPGRITALAFSPDGRLLAGGGEAGRVSVWDCGDGRVLRELPPQQWPVEQLALGPDGRLLIVADSYRPARLWDLQNGRPLPPLQGGATSLNALALSPDGRLLAGTGLNGAVHVWELPGGRLLRSLRVGEDAGDLDCWDGELFLPTCVTVSPEGEVLVGDGQGDIWRWALPKGRPLPDLDGHTASVCRLALRADGRLLASTDHGQTARLWRLPEGDCLTVLPHDLDAPQALRLTESGLALAGSSWQGAAHVHRLAGGGAVQAAAECPQPIHTLALSLRGQVLAGGCRGGAVWLWRATDGQALGSFQTEMEWVAALAFSPDGALLAAGDSQGHVQLWRVAGPERVRTLQGGWLATCVAFSAEGGLLAVGCEAGAVQVWGLPEGRRLRTLSDPTTVFSSLAFSPDGSVLATAGRAEPEDADQRGVVRLWGLPDWEPRGELEGHQGQVFALAFSADGRELAALDDGQRVALCGHAFIGSKGGGPNQAVCLWERPSGRLRERVAVPELALACLASGGDGWLLAGKSDRYLVRLWTSELLRLSRVPAGRISADERAWLDERLRDPSTAEGERRAVELIAALARHRRRFDIHVADAPPRAEPGPTDIEIAG
jgi:WD40 repeat protein